MKKTTLICIAILAITYQSLWAGISITPILDFGVESNDNLSLSSTTTENVTASKAGIGIGISSYLSPDLSLNAGFQSNIDKYMNSNFDQYVKNQAYATLQYSFGPQLTLNGSVFYDTFKEVESSGNQYSKLIFKPRLSYYFNPNLGLDVYYENSGLQYNDVDIDTAENNYGGTLYLPLNHWISLGAGYEVADSSSLETTYNFSGTTMKGEAYAQLSANQLLTLIYSKGNSEYPNWDTERTDEDTTIGVQYLQFLTDSLQLNGGYSNTVRISTDTDESFTNNIAFAGLRWTPQLGTPYDYGAKNFLSYLFSHAERAIERGHYLDAEKQLLKIVFYEQDMDDAHFELGYVYTKMGYHHAAINYLETSMLLDEERLEAYYLLAHNYLKIGDTEMGALVLEALYEKNGDSKVAKMLEKLAK
ncbi:hypothetical protein HOH87_03760 [bacterium]|nr:hypothetical protein [bacterium]